MEKARLNRTIVGDHGRNPRRIAHWSLMGHIAETSPENIDDSC
jgi:hypothetical protein